MPAAKPNQKPTIDQQWHVWQKCVKGYDVNSLSNQFITQNLDHAIYLMNQEDMHILLETFPQKPPINNHFQNMISRTFFHYQLVGIKRLRDKTGSRLDGDKATECSLHALITAIKKASGKLTRSLYIQLFLNTSQIVQSERESDATIKSNIEEINRVFDKVSGTVKENRSETDIPLVSFFICLQEKIKQTDQVYKIANKMSAHLATPESRDNELKNSFADFVTLRQAFKDLYIVYLVLYRFLFIYHSRLAIVLLPTYSKNWTSTNIDPTNEERIRAVYDDMVVETESWLDQDLPQFWAQIHTATTNELQSKNTSKSA